MSVSLKRHARLESVTWQAANGIDGQGKPTFVTPGTVLQAHVERNQEVVRLGTGEEVRIVATLWFDAAQSTTLPTSDDKLVLSDMTGIVVMRDQSGPLQSGEVDHVEVMVKQA